MKFLQIVATAQTLCINIILSCAALNDYIQYFTLSTTALKMKKRTSWFHKLILFTLNAGAIQLLLLNTNFQQRMHGIWALHLTHGDRSSLQTMPVNCYVSSELSLPQSATSELWAQFEDISALICVDFLSTESNICILSGICDAITLLLSSESS